MLESKFACIVEFGGVTIYPGSNELSDEDLKKVVGTADGKFCVENGKFVVTKKKAGTASSEGKSE